jgi:hypothetical protein
MVHLKIFGMVENGSRGLGRETARAKDHREEGQQQQWQRVNMANPIHKSACNWLGCFIYTFHY